MDLLKELNLAPVKKSTGRNPIVSRRQSLIKGIDKQLSITNSMISSNDFARDHQTGRKFPCWFWMDDSGKYYLSINYGKQPLELSRGKYSVICESVEDIQRSLEVIKMSVQKGDLDSQLEKRSRIIRDGFAQ